MEFWNVNCSEEQWKRLQNYLKEQYLMRKKKKEKKNKKQKTYLLIYSPSESIIVERLTEEEINSRIRQYELDNDEFTVVDGEIIRKLS